MTDLVERSLELLAERAGDPAPLIYARLFSALPGSEALFGDDVGGAVRGEMLAVAFQCLMDPDGAYTANLVVAERMNHDDWGVPPEHFARFFPILRDVCREVLCADWTPEIETAWAARLAKLCA